MNRTAHILSLLVVIGTVVSVAYGLDYLWLTDQEQTIWGDRIKFAHGDTLDGPVHSNSVIAIMQDPVFMDQVTTTEDDFWHGAGYNPQFLGPPPQFNTPVVRINYFDELVDHARVAGQYYDDSNMRIFLDFLGDSIHAYQWPVGIFTDSTNTWDIPLDNNTCIFSEGPVRVQGIVDGRVTVGSAQQIEIENDIRYVDADPLTGETPLNSDNLLALYSLGDIKIRNTYANGRENSGGRGSEQTNPDSTNVVIAAAIWAVGGSFTFENQNDPDSGYVCDCQPDNRGTLNVFGGIVQERRGYLHRSNNQSTGYSLHLRFDQRLRYVRAPGENYYGQSNEDTLNFGDVPVGETVWTEDTIRTQSRYYLGAVYANLPFHALREPPFQGPNYYIPVSFSPTRTGIFNGMLYVTIGPNNYQIPLRGRGVPQGGPQPLTMDVAPNPFNLTTAIRFNLPEAGDVRIALYDILGREAKTISIPQAASGEHSIVLDAANLASGVYFLRLQTGNAAISRKLLLLK